MVSFEVVAGGGRGSVVSIVYSGGRSSKVGPLQEMKLASYHR